MVHYEDIVEQTTPAGFLNATDRIASYLDSDPTLLRFFLARNTASHDQQHQGRQPTAIQRQYVDYLFLLSKSAPDWYPRLWPELGRYIEDARNAMDPNAALRTRRLGPPGRRRAES